MKLGIHAMAWTNHWSNASLDLIDRARSLGMDFIEIPLLDLADIDPPAIRERLRATAFDVVTSTVLSAATDLTADDEATRAAGVAYLLRCVEATAAMGARQFSGVIYSEIGRRPPFRPTERHWHWAAEGLRAVVDRAAALDVTVAVEPVNRYETFLVNTAAQAAQLCDLIDRPNMAIHLDTYHMNIEETRWDEPVRAGGRPPAPHPPLRERPGHSGHGPGRLGQPVRRPGRAPLRWLRGHGELRRRLRRHAPCHARLARPCPERRRPRARRGALPARQGGGGRLALRPRRAGMTLR